jgi:hypothetical protein
MSICYQATLLSRPLFCIYGFRFVWISYGISGQARLPKREPEAYATMAISVACLHFIRLAIVPSIASIFVCHRETQLIQNYSRQARTSCPPAVTRADGCHVLSQTLKQPLGEHFLGESH